MWLAARTRSVALASSLALLPLVAAAAERGASLDATLKPYLAKFGLPALAAAVVLKGRVVASGAVGTRRVGHDIPVTITDRFHIGSDTKAMTSLLTAMLIEEGKLRWDTRMEEVFPELAGTMDAGLKTVTLTQLMSHTSGLPSDSDELDAVLNKAMLAPGNLDQQRYWLLTQWASKPLAAKPGEVWAYSNLGYTVLGAVVERTAGATWEELVATRIFDRLALRTAGFGPQASLGRVDAPLGHDLQDGKPFAYLAGPNGDNPEIIGPAGTVHLSVLDFATWAGWQTGEGKRGPALVRPETLRRLHTRVADMPMKEDAPTGTPARGQAKGAGYALGWGEITLPFSPEPFVFHGGSNEKNYAVIMMQPPRDFAMVMMTNIGGPKADEAIRGLGAELYGRYVGR